MHERIANIGWNFSLAGPASGVFGHGRAGFAGRALRGFSVNVLTVGESALTGQMTAKCTARPRRPRHVGRQVEPNDALPTERGLVAWLIGDAWALDGCELLGECRENLVVEGLLLAT